MEISKSALEYEKRTTQSKTTTITFTESKINARIFGNKVRAEEAAYWFNWNDVPQVIDSPEEHTEAWDDEAYYAQ